MAEFSTLPPHLQASYTRDPRYLRSQAMRKQSQGIQDIRHPLQGLAQMLMAYKSGQSAKDVRSEYDEKGTAYNEALGRALGMIQPGTEEIPAAGPPTAMGEFPTATRDVPADYAGAAREMAKVGGPLATQFAIAGSRDTQALKATKEKRLYDETQAKIADERAIERFRTEQEIKSEYPTTASGRPAANLQYATEINTLRGNIQAAEESGDPAAIAQAKQQFEDFQYVMSKDPEALREQAFASTSGKGEAELETAAPKAELTATGSAMGVSNMKLYDTVQTSIKTRDKANSLLEHLNSSDAITGMGAEMFKGIERLKTLMGDDIAAGKVADTEILNAMMGSEVFGMIKSLGIGARGLDTPAEREFLLSVMTGTITLNKKTLIRLAEIRRDIGQRVVDRWNDKTERGELDNFYKATGLQKTQLGKLKDSENAIKSDEEYNALPSGTVFTGPDGQQRTKP